MKATLIVTTYNWPAALELTFRSIAQQSVLPAEIIVADDGSGAETAQLVRSWQEKLSCNVVHSWQEDQGYRLARSRNRAIASARCPYIVLIDGDMILHPRFIEDHMACARSQCFIQGTRPRLSAPTTQQLLANELHQPTFMTRGLEHRAYALRSPLLSRWASSVKASLGGIQGCNQSFWREHALRVNGYDERFIGWGPEDREFVARLLHIGVLRNYVRHRAIAFHLHHTARAQGPGTFDHILDETLRTRALRCKHGIDTHQDIVPSAPTPDEDALLQQTHQTNH
jgi:glycosyltransferase involved in cell wall biosynthesis